MEKHWNALWKASTQPRKQRKYVRNSPQHVRSALLVSTLSKELRKKHKMRSARVRKGDLVKVLRGQFRKHSGKVERIDDAKQRIYVNGAHVSKKDGSKATYPLHPSNLMILEFDTTHSRKFQKKTKKLPENSKATEKP